MLLPIVSLLLEVVFGLLTGVCLLRLYLHYQRIALSAHSGNPLGPFVFALSDWLVLPLRRVLPQGGRLDGASLLAALLLQVAHTLLLGLFSGALLGAGAWDGSALWVLVVGALLGLLRMALSGLTGLVFVYVLMSWVQAQSYVADLLQRMVSPLLAPIRRHLPLVGGVVDLSPLVLLVLLQIAGMLLSALQSTLLRGWAV